MELCELQFSSVKARIEHRELHGMKEPYDRSNSQFEAI
jgi:hypothetical protein